MSRFGASATFFYNTGDALDSVTATYVYMNAGQMPQYPFETSNITDRVSYRTKSGRKYSYENYNLRRYKMNWTMLDEGMRGSLKTMFDAKPILSFLSNGTSWGTYRMMDDSWQDSEVAFELYDLNIGIEEDNTGTYTAV